MKYILPCALLIASPALACEPVASTLDDHIKAADLIFAGKVVEVKTPEDITFDVQKVWKGEPGKRITLKTVANTCGISGVTPGIEMVIFAKGNPPVTTSVDGDYVLAIPGGKPVGDTSEIDKKLGSGKTP